MLTTEEIKERVQKGAELLDEKYPGWYKKINCNKLDIEEPQLCILKQLYGNYSDGVIILNISWPSRYGFNCSYKNNTEMTQMWIRHIKLRKGLEPSLWQRFINYLEKTFS